MLIDSFLVLVMEHSSFEGNRGDSCAETARYAHLKMLLGDYKSDVNLNIFVTPLGYIRHPEVPDSWKEKDFSEDQGKPLYLAFKKMQSPQMDEMKKRINNADNRMGNGDLITPGFYGILHDYNWLNTTSVFVQSLIFKFPYRWSDSKKWFEKSEGSSADYLNHIHTAVYAPKIIRKMVSKDRLKERIRHYYSNEPNSQFIIDLYDQVIERFW